MKSNKISSFFGKHWRAIGGGFLILLMVASSFGMIGTYLSDSGNSTTSKNEYVGTFRGIDVYKADTTDYLANLNGVEWHFRANPMEAGNITLESKHRLILGTLTSGPGMFDVMTGKTFENALILLDPESNSRVTLAATEIASALGAKGWVPEVVFTKASPQRPDVRVMTLSEAQALNESAIVMYFDVSADLPTPSSTLLYYSTETKGAAIFIMGRDFDSLDKTADAVKMFLLGWTQ